MPRTSQETRWCTLPSVITATMARTSTWLYRALIFLLDVGAQYGATVYRSATLHVPDDSLAPWYLTQQDTAIVWVEQ